MFFNMRQQPVRKIEEVKSSIPPSVFDHIFYLDTYTDLAKEKIITKSDALLHYMTIGRKEGRYGSYEDMMNKHTLITGQNLVDIFDHKFYLDTYTDLGKKGITTQRDALIHFMQSGMKEGRAYSKENMGERFTNNLHTAKDELAEFQDTTNKEFRILIRTSNRPESCRKCIESILEQTYQNFHVYICYDDDKSLEYLNKYENDERITYFPVQVDSDEKYRFNLYCNSLLEKVTDGYILFLDDDDMLVGPRMLEALNHQIGSDKITVWRFLRPDKLIYPASLDHDLVLGEIDTASVCFHHSLKKMSRWGDKQYGDYLFYKTLFNACPRNKMNMLEYTLTATQFDDKIGNYGNNVIV